MIRTLDLRDLAKELEDLRERFADKERVTSCLSK